MANTCELHGQPVGVGLISTGHFHQGSQEQGAGAEAREGQLGWPKGCARRGGSQGHQSQALALRVRQYWVHPARPRQSHTVKGSDIYISHELTEKTGRFLRHSHGNSPAVAHPEQTGLGTAQTQTPKPNPEPSCYCQPHAGPPTPGKQLLPRMVPSVFPGSERARQREGRAQGRFQREWMEEMMAGNKVILFFHSLIQHSSIPATQLGRSQGIRGGGGGVSSHRKAGRCHDFIKVMAFLRPPAQLPASHSQKITTVAQ